MSNNPVSGVTSGIHRGNKYARHKSMLAMHLIAFTERNKNTEITLNTFKTHGMVNMYENQKGIWKKYTNIFTSFQ
jgi:hypothetical protein